ncbi:DUF6381 family protein [Streptomyces curacoi]|uniref:DUF6381 family protein n=1 Tax=Streptomyces curacoi TaxID=146536 RepID=UPI000AE9C6D1|nr:DUF6381 family protein [Streptomyces curacoi]
MSSEETRERLQEQARLLAVRAESTHNPLERKQLLEQARKLHEASGKQSGDIDPSE